MKTVELITDVEFVELPIEMDLNPNLYNPLC